MCLNKRKKMNNDKDRNGKIKKQQSLEKIANT
jgi:hypothetical protein